MRLGALDIGSNAAQLRIVDVTAGGPPLPAQAVKEPTLPPSRAQLKVMRRHIRETLREIADRVRWEGDPRRVQTGAARYADVDSAAGQDARR